MAMQSANDHGLLVLDKPQGITSRDAVNRVQQWFPRGTRIGHAGTLDPLATGVLVVCVGTATRLIEYIQDMDKEYVTDLVLGAVSDSDDADGTITVLPDIVPPKEDVIQQELTRFLGWIEQVPPAYSAARVGGQRAYKLARKGKEVSLAPRPVRMDGIDLLDYHYPDLRLQIRCGKGTYIRSLARDLGQRLGCGAYVRTLRRRRVGPFIPELATPLNREAESPLSLLPLEKAVCQLPSVAVSPEQFRRLQQGQTLNLDKRDLPVSKEKTELAVFLKERLAAIGAWNGTTGTLAPIKVLASERE